MKIKKYVLMKTTKMLDAFFNISIYEEIENFMQLKHIIRIKIVSLVPLDTKTKSMIKI